MERRKRNGKHLISIAICAILVMSLVACSTGGTTTGSANPSTSGTTSGTTTAGTTTPAAYTYAGSAPIADETITLSILTTNSGSKMLGFADMAWWQEVLKRANVTLEMEEIDSSSYGDVIKPRLAAAVDLPDIVKMPGADDDMAYIKSGIFVELTDYYEDYGYNFAKQFDEHTMLKGSLTTPDGKIFYAPYIYTTANNSRCLMVNKDFVESVGMQLGDIKTIDDFYAYLTAVAQNDANGNGDAADEVALFSRSGMIQLWSMFWGLDVTGTFQREADGKVICGYADERYREMLVFLNQLFEEKLLYSEFATANYDTQQALFTNNQIGSLIHFVSNCTSYSQAIDPDWDFYNDEPIIQPVVPLTGPHGDQHVYGRDSMGSLFGITRYCEDPESAFKFIDYLMSDEVGELTWYGIEGTDYEIVDGEIQFTEVYLKSEDGYRSNQGYNFDGLPSYQLGGGYMATQCKFVRDMSNDVLVKYVMNPTITFSYKLEEENEVIRSYVADLKTNFSENLTAFIMGTRSLDTWDAYIADLQKMNLDKVLEVYQAVSDRQAASK
ncbi:MAG: extracellular solute-binding protein [Clostridiaceae bacterium]|nr:extracellular solute-binding protein [Eubacteriales bacterium]NLV48702.1 extracellular solute-binding protein [Clostridiaceae bacterium]